MFREPKLRTQDARLDEFCCELLSVIRVSEDEVTGVASSSYAYDRVRFRIATIGQRTSRRSSVYERLSPLQGSLLSAPRFVVLSGAAAIVVLLAAALFVLLPGPSSVELVKPVNEAVAPSTSDESKTEPENIAATASRGDQSRRTKQRRQRLESRSSEVATDFLPLTFVEDSSAPQSGHVVRMKVPRSALIAFGVPMNMERAGELITADVVIGDDGLARAIRFVQ